MYDDYDDQDECPDECIASDDGEHCSCYYEDGEACCACGRQPIYED